MPTFTIRAYGVIDFAVAARTKQAAISRINRLFDRMNANDPLSGKLLFPDLGINGFVITHPEETKEVQNGTETR